MKEFRGKRDNDDQSTTRLYLVDGDNVTEIDPVRSQSVYNHSPTGFNWGYGGSGPAQCALAVLLEATDDEAVARKFYQPFKWQFIATFPHDEWSLSLSEIEAWLALQVTTSIAG